MGTAVSNSSGDIFYSKVVDALVTPVNNILDNTNASDDVTPANGKWTKVDSHVTTSVYTINESEAGPAKNSTGIKIDVAVGAGSAQGVLAYGRFASTDISSYDAVTFYIRAYNSVAPVNGMAFAANTISLRLCTDTAGATPVETLAIPAIPQTTLTGDGAASTDADVDQWVRVVLKLNNPSSDTAIRSVSFFVTETGFGTENFEGNTLYIYQVRLLKSFPGRINFSISETVDSIDTTDYQSLGAKEFEPSYSSWTCNFDGHKEGVPPLVKGKEYVFGIWESDTLGHCWVGNGFYSSLNPSGSVTETIKYPYSVAGRTYLSKPLA